MFFEGWKRARRIKLLKTLINLIHKRLAFGVSVSVRLDDFDEVLPTRKPKDRLVGAYSIAVIDSTKKAEVWARSQGLDNPISYFIETGSRLARVVPKVWHSFGSKNREAMLMGSLDFGSKKVDEFQPNFEAADILAYESWKFSSYGSGNLRRSFAKLLRQTDFGHCLGVQEIEWLFSRFCPPDQLEAYLAQFEDTR